ncbi:MAG: type II secretion system minor pseudopilin GspI [Nevskiaceae bacterium]|jgi:general secretion pathway protein I|nr:type II secretion system minor pseudopilin GspI [Nevskiaceae bacterium]
MNPRTCADRNAGFTLIEVLVALVVVALGVGALMAALTSAADNISYMRNKSFAEWIALNQISELRLAVGTPAVGEANGDVEYAGQRWRWHREVTDQGVADMMRMEITVSLLNGGRPSPTLATAWGFIGKAVGQPSGIDPDWSLQSIAGGSGGNDGTDGNDNDGDSDDEDNAPPSPSRAPDRYPGPVREPSP